MEGNVEQVKEDQLANQREPMKQESIKHILQTVESNVIKQEREEQPADQW